MPVSDNVLTIDDDLSTRLLQVLEAARFGNMAATKLGEAFDQPVENRIPVKIEKAIDHQIVARRLLKGMRISLMEGKVLVRETGKNPLRRLRHKLDKRIQAKIELGDYEGWPIPDEYHATVHDNIVIVFSNSGLTSEQARVATGFLCLYLRIDGAEADGEEGDVFYDARQG